jgi:hypothetical protein
MSMLSTCVGFMLQKSENIDMSDSTPHWRADKPWNQLPPLPPAADLETKAVLKQCITEPDDAHQHAAAAGGQRQLGN